MNSEEMMKKYLCIIFAVCFISTGFAQKKLTLNDALKIALQKNPTLIKNSNNIITSKSNVKNAYGELLPTFSIGSGFSWRRFDNDKPQVFTDQFGQKISVFNKNKQQRTYSMRAGGSVVLFNGLANYANIAKAENDLKSAKYRINKLKQDIVLQTTTLYYNVLKAEKLFKAREENLKYNSKLLEQITEKNKLGSVAIVDVYAQEVQKGNAELLLIQAQNNFEKAKNSLLDYLALNVLDDYEFVDINNNLIADNYYLENYNNIRSLVSKALTRRNDFKAQQLSLESAYKSITIAKSGLLPTLSADYSFSTSSESNAKDLFKNRSYSAGLSLNIPIFSNWRTENQIQIAEVRAMNSEEDLSALERTIKIQVKQGFLDLSAAKKSLDVANKKVISAKENLKINSERYNLGAGTIIELLRADSQYIQAKSDQIDAEYEYLRLKDTLMNYLGELDYKNFE